MSLSATTSRPRLLAGLLLCMLPLAACGQSAPEKPTPSPSGSSTATSSPSSSGGAASASPTASAPSTATSSAAVSSSPKASASPSASPSASASAEPTPAGQRVTTADGRVSVWVPATWKPFYVAPGIQAFEDPEGLGKIAIATMGENLSASTTGVQKLGMQVGGVPGVPGARWVEGYFPGQAPGAGAITGYLTAEGEVLDKGFPLGDGAKVGLVSYVREWRTSGVPTSAEIQQQLDAFRASQTGKDVRRILESVQVNANGAGDSGITDSGARAACNGNTYDYGDFVGVTCEEAKRTIDLYLAGDITPQGPASWKASNGIACTPVTSGQVMSGENWKFKCSGNEPGVSGRSFTIYEKGKRPAGSE